MRGEAIATWGAVVAWTWLIWGLGGDDFSLASTSRILGPLLQWLFPGISPESLEIVHIAVRKGFHALEYAALALLALRALLLTWALPAARGAALALAFTLAVAASDEARQAWSGAREGAWADVVLDLAGAGAAVAAVRVLPGWAKRLLIGRGD
ncbi:MAG: VanZ family protein [Proteobacteria bacterium]|nr:VanZ family protein [Pseudomonadota bacterium]